MALAVDQLSLGQIGTNCYLVRADRSATTAVVVDPGADAAEIRLSLARSGATCAGILLTHSHYDHIGALADLAEGTGAPVWLPQGELDVFRRPNDFFPGISVRAYEGEATLLAGGETVEPAGISFQVLHVPGHSPGHVSYYADGCLFSGDVLFAGSVGRTDLPFGDWETLVESIRSLTDAYPPETVVYSGHGPADDARRRARSQSVPRRASRVKHPATARHARHPPVGAAALAARHRRDGASLRALRLPARSRRPSSRTPSSSRARRAPAPTSSRRRCTPSPTAPTGR